MSTCWQYGSYTSNKRIPVGLPYGASLCVGSANWSKCAATYLPITVAIFPLVARSTIDSPTPLPPLCAASSSAGGFIRPGSRSAFGSVGGPAWARCKLDIRTGGVAVGVRDVGSDVEQFQWGFVIYGCVRLQTWSVNLRPNIYECVVLVTWLRIKEHTCVCTRSPF